MHSKYFRPRVSSYPPGYPVNETYKDFLNAKRAEALWRLNQELDFVRLISNMLETLGWGLLTTAGESPQSSGPKETIRTGHAGFLSVTLSQSGFSPPCPTHLSP